MTISNTTRTITAGAAAIVLSVGAAACGSDDDDTIASLPPAAEANSFPPPSEPVDAPTVEAAAELLVGLPEADAEAAARDAGWEFRVSRRDGEDLAVTADLRPNRVNVEVTDEVVTDVLSIG